MSLMILDLFKTSFKGKLEYKAVTIMQGVVQENK